MGVKELCGGPIRASLCHARSVLISLYVRQAALQQQGQSPNGGLSSRSSCFARITARRGQAAPLPYFFFPSPSPSFSEGGGAGTSAV